jgi:hypothetical protein
VTTPAIRNFKYLERNTLRGFFDLELPSGLVLSGCPLHTKGERWWIGMPAKPYTKPDGEQTWAKIVDFRDKQTSDRFQETIIPIAREAFERARRAA